MEETKRLLLEEYVKDRAIILGIELYPTEKEELIEFLR